MHTDRSQDLVGVCLALCVAVVSGATDLLAQGDRYVAHFADGSTLSGDKLLNSYRWSYSTNVPAIGGQPLLQGSSALRCIRDTRLATSPAGPCILLANGDILPGRVVGVAPADPQAGLEKRMVVNLTPPLRACSERSTEVELRIDCIAHILSDSPAERDRRPGTLRLSDGRVIAFKAIRWSAEGLRALTDDDIVKATYAELREYHALSADPVSAILADSSAPCPDPDSPLVRVRASNGAALTGREALFIDVGWSHIAVKPTWAYSGICFGPDDVVSRDYRSPREVPLSLLRAELLDEHSFTGFLWPWRRNASVRGGELRSGTVAGTLGIGTHAFNTLAFDLPPGAAAFSTWVGLDRAVGVGGCVRCGIYGDSRDGPPLWRSGYLRGGDRPVKVELGDIGGLGRLVLVTEFGHEGRPEGADPLDIRDEVDWIDPTVTLAKVPSPATSAEAPDVLGHLGEWGAPDGAFENCLVVPVWRWGGRRCSAGVYSELTDTVRLRRRVNVSLTNSWLQISVARGRRGGDGLRNGHTVTVLADGKRQEIINTYRPCTTTNLLSGHVRIRQWGLGAFVGREVELEVVIKPERRDRTRALPGLILVDFFLGPVVEDLSGDGTEVITPEVPIVTLTPRRVAIPVPGARLQPGKLSNGRPIRICRYAFKDGYGVPAGSELVYGLDPGWKRFVAVLGMNRDVALPPEEGREMSYEVGPFRVLLDGEVHWQSSQPETFGLWDRGLQVNIEIPPGHKTIALQASTGHCYAVWACSGFMKE
jgi:hypothetical protein